MGKKSNLDKALEEKARKKAEQKKEDKRYGQIWVKTYLSQP